jgi:hypothetical protein
MNVERATICLGSAGQPANRQSGSDFGNLPNAPGCKSHRAIEKCWRQAAANYTLVPQPRDAPRK